MAQDPDRDDEQRDMEGVDTSDDLDMVTLFQSSAVDAEMETQNIHGLLEANGIPSMIVGARMIPVLDFQVQVPRDRLEEARRLLDQARETGPQDAAEAEEASEKGE